MNLDAPERVHLAERPRRRLRGRRVGVVRERGRGEEVPGRGLRAGRPVVQQRHDAHPGEDDVLARLGGEPGEPGDEKRRRAHAALRLHAPDAELTIVHRRLLLRETLHGDERSRRENENPGRGTRRERPRSVSKRETIARLD